MLVPILPQQHSQVFSILLGILLSSINFLFIWFFLIIFLFSRFIFICLRASLILSWSRLFCLGSVFRLLCRSRLLLGFFALSICSFGWLFWLLNFLCLLFNRLLFNGRLSWIFGLRRLLLRFFCFLWLLWFSGLFNNRLNWLLNGWLFLLWLFFDRLGWFLHFGFGY